MSDNSSVTRADCESMSAVDMELREWHSKFRVPILDAPQSSPRWVLVIALLFLCGCSTRVFRSLDSTEAEREAAYQNMSVEIQWVMKAEEAGDFPVAQERLNRIRQWANTILDHHKRNACLYWVDVWDSIIDHDRAVAKVKPYMPVPESIR